jgi:hypothetical protein
MCQLLAYQEELCSVELKYAGNLKVQEMELQ